MLKGGYDGVDKKAQFGGYENRMSLGGYVTSTATCDQ